MTELSTYHQNMGALLAPDGIPLHYGNLKTEYLAALKSAILLDRSHEGRILVEGESRFDLVNRMSTNNMLDMMAFEGRPTVFINANARILFRVMCFNLRAGLLMISEPGQGQALCNLLRRNMFFGDKVELRDQTPATAQFAIHGPNADRIMQRLDIDLPTPGDFIADEVELGGTPATAARRESIAGPHWIVICPAEGALSMHRHILEVGESIGLQPAGSLTFNVLRISSGRPAAAELSSEFIPIELGLWDEVSFTKGCYTGQEIIARMESRQRLAKVMVKLELAHMVEAPATVLSDGKECGKLTSSATSPRGEIFALAVIKTKSAQPGTPLEVGDERRVARVIDYAGVQPDFIIN